MFAKFCKKVSSFFMNLPTGLKTFDLGSTNLPKNYVMPLAGSYKLIYLLLISTKTCQFSNYFTTVNS